MDSVREFLESVREAKIELRRCEIRLEQLSTQATSITAPLSDMPRGGGDKHKDSLLVAIADQRTKIEQARRNWIQRIIDVEEFIDEIDDATERIILKLRYCDLMQWSEIQSQLNVFGLGYGGRHIYKIHGRALNEARRLWENWEVKSNVDCGSKKKDKQKLEE